MPFIILKHDAIQALKLSPAMCADGNLLVHANVRKTRGTSLLPCLRERLPWYKEKELQAACTAIIAIAKNDVLEEVINQIPGYSNVVTAILGIIKDEISSKALDLIPTALVVAKFISAANNRKIMKRNGMAVKYPHYLSLPLSSCRPL